MNGALSSVHGDCTFEGDFIFVGHRLFSNVRSFFVKSICAAAVRLSFGDGDDVCVACISFWSPPRRMEARGPPGPLARVGLPLAHTRFQSVRSAPPSFFG